MDIMILEINRDNINFFKYIKEEIELYLGEKKEKITDIRYIESCMYEYAIDEEGRETIIEGDSGMIKIEIREYEITEEEFNKNLYKI